MSKLINITDEESIQKGLNRLIKAINIAANAEGKKPEILLFEAIVGLLYQYPNLPSNADKTLQDKFSDIMNVLSSAAFTMIERYCEGNRPGAYYATDLMAKMILRKLSEKYTVEDSKEKLVVS